MSRDSATGPQAQTVLRRSRSPNVADPAALRRQLAWVGWAFASVIAALIALFPVVANSGKNDLPLFLMGYLVVMTTLGYLIALALLAHSLGRRWLTDCFFALFSFPVGIIVGYVLIRNAVKRELRR